MTGRVSEGRVPGAYWVLLRGHTAFQPALWSRHGEWSVLGSPIRLQDHHLAEIDERPIERAALAARGEEG
jgi:hypothetical protein